MAISAGKRAQMTRYAVNWLNQTRGGKLKATGKGAQNVQSDMIKAMRHAFRGQDEGVVLSTLQAIARRAVEMQDAAVRLNRNPAMAIAASALPQDATIFPEQQRFRYRVLVSVPDGAGGWTSVATDIRSDAPLSLNQITERARQSSQWDEYPDSAKGRAIIHNLDNAALTVEVLSAGKR